MTASPPIDARDELAARDHERKPDHAWPAHLVALLDRQLHARRRPSAASARADRRRPRRPSRSPGPPAPPCAGANMRAWNCMAGLRRVSPQNRIGAGPSSNPNAASQSGSRRARAPSPRAAHRHEREGMPGRPARRAKRAEADVGRWQPERRRDRAPSTGGARRPRPAVAVARSARGHAHRPIGVTMQRTGPIPSSSTNSRAAGAAIDAAEQHRGADGRMAGERQFPRRREDAQPRAMRGSARRQHEHGLGQVELARDRLHRRRVEPLAHRARPRADCRRSAGR